MQTRAIPQSEWPGFLNSFSSRHLGWTVNVEVFGLDIGAQVEGTGLLFRGLTDEWDEIKGSTITIMAANKADGHVSHSISRPTEISLEITDGGDDAVLAITGEDGLRTLLTFV